VPLDLTDAPRTGVSAGLLRGGWRSWRDRLLADPRFQRWAAAFPLTRPIARKRARALFDVCAGFVYSQVLLACLQLRLFDVLFEGPQSADALAARLSMSPAAMQRLLSAAASLNLVERRGRLLWGLGPLGAAVVGNPGIAAMIEHNALLYADLQDPVSLLRGETRGTAIARFWPYAATEGGTHGDVPAEAAAAYSRLMGVSQAMIANDVISAYPFSRHRRLLDVGAPRETLGRTAVVQGRLAYQLFRERFSGPRWEALAAAGARVQRPLWASTSTKNPDYPDTLYVDDLIGPDTVNTLPDATVDAFDDHGTVARTVDADEPADRRFWNELPSLGIDMAEVGRKLEQEGLASFVASFDDLLATLAAKA